MIQYEFSYPYKAFCVVFRILKDISRCNTWTPLSANVNPTPVYLACHIATTHRVSCTGVVRLVAQHRLEISLSRCKDVGRLPYFFVPLFELITIRTNGIQHMSSGSSRLHYLNWNGVRARGILEAVVRAGGDARHLLKIISRISNDSRFSAAPAARFICKPRIADIWQCFVFNIIVSCW